MSQCPHCRGDLIDDTSSAVWIVVFSTLTTIAADLDTSSFEIEVLLSSNASVTESLGSTNGVVSGDRTVYTWTITRPGDPVSGTITVDHTNGSYEQSLEVSELSAAA